MERLVYSVGKDVDTATQRDWMFAVFHAVRDRIVKRWRETLQQARDHNAKRVYYLSMEYLTGRVLVNALLATDLYDVVKQACTQLGADFDALVEVEPDPALGNGGLGRLAACFMDSIATIGLVGMGYGLRYEYGMFSQRIVNGQQVEEPDYWLVNGNPWEFMRPELCYTVRFGGRLSCDECDVVQWVDTEEVIATAYDNGVPGYGMNSVATMRLWAARASSAMNLEAFNRGDYMGAVEAKNQSENVTARAVPRGQHGARQGTAPAPGIFLRQCVDAGHVAPLPAQPRQFRCAARQGGDPPERHPPGPGHPRADAPADRRAQRALGRCLVAVHASLLLHQPHPDARGAGDLVGRPDGPPAAAPPAHHLRPQRAFPGGRARPVSGRAGPAGAGFADRRERRAARAHGLPVGAGQPQGQRRVAPAQRTDRAAPSLPISRGSFPSASATRPTASRPRRWLAQANRPLVRADRQPHRRRLAAAPGRTRPAAPAGARKPSSEARFAWPSSRTSSGWSRTSPTACTGPSSTRKACSTSRSSACTNTSASC